MPRYFFHVMDGQDFPDHQGVEVADLPDARRHAIRVAGNLLLDISDTFWSTGEWTIRVADYRDLTQFQLTFFATEAPVTQAHGPKPRIDH